MRLIFCLVFFVLSAGCADGLTRCELSTECPRGELCLDSVCQDASVFRDSATPDAADVATDTEPDSSVADSSVADSAVPDALVDSGPDTAADSASDTSVDTGVPGLCGDESCALLTLGPGDTRWRGWAAEDGTFAPRAPVQAAFDLETEGVAYALTDSSYHVLRLSDRSWIEDGPRNSLFPEAAGVALVLAYSIPKDHAGGDGINEGVVLLGLDAAYSYSMNVESRDVSHTLTTTDFGEAWESLSAPRRGELRFGWLDTSNSRGWAEGDPSMICSARPRDIQVYTALSTAGRTHLLESGVCFEFLPPVVNRTFAPFVATDAPEPATLGATFWNRGSLWAIRG